MNINFLFNLWTPSSNLYRLSIRLETSENWYSLPFVVLECVRRVALSFSYVIDGASTLV